jgi:RNA polymerase sigma factor (sigma-70 family)
VKCKKKKPKFAVALTKHNRSTIDALMYEHTGLVKCIAQDFADPGIELDDLIQEGFLALWEAIFYHKPEVGPLDKYAAAAIRKRMKRWMGHTNNKPFATVNFLDESVAATLKRKPKPIVAD